MDKNELIFTHPMGVQRFGLPLEYGFQCRQCNAKTEMYKTIDSAKKAQATDMKHKQWCQYEEDR